MIDDQFNTEQQFIHLLLKHQDLVKDWRGSSLGVECFLTEHKFLLEAIIKAYSEDVLLSRKAFVDYSRRYLKKKIEMGAQEDVYNRISFEMANRNDFPMLKQKILDAYQIRKSTDYIRDFNKNRETGGSSFAVAELAKSMTDLSAGSGEGSKVDRQAVATIQELIASPISLQSLYERAPVPIKRLTQLLYTSSPKMPPCAHFLVAMNIAGGLMGKRLVGRNMAAYYYCNPWIVILVPTAGGKSNVSMTVKILREIAETADRCPFDLLGDRFTMAYAYSELGGQIIKREWAGLSEEQQIKKKREIRLANMQRRGKTIIADEFGYTFQKLISSGVEDGELGSILKLADSGSEQTQSTGTDGYRSINDCCLSIIGFSQPDLWHKTFNAREHLDSGLIGRFFIADIKDYSLALDRLPYGYNECETEIRRVLADVVAKVAGLGEPLVADFYADPINDRLGNIFDRLVSGDKLRVFAEMGQANFETIRGKAIYQAMKMTMIDQFLRLEKPTGEGLVDWAAYEAYLGLILCGFAKLMTADPPKSETEIIEDRIRDILVKAKDNTVTLRAIQRQNFKFKGGSHPLNKFQVYDIVEGMEDVRLDTVKGRGKPTVNVVWLGRQNRTAGAAVKTKAEPLVTAKDVSIFPTPETMADKTKPNLGASTFNASLAAAGDVYQSGDDERMDYLADDAGGAAGGSESVGGGPDDEADSSLEPPH